MFIRVFINAENIHALKKGNGLTRAYASKEEAIEHWGSAMEVLVTPEEISEEKSVTYGGIYIHQIKNNTDTS